MSNILGYVTIDQGAIITVDGIPSAGGGTAAPIGTIAEYNDGVNGTAYLKSGASDTAWDLIGTASGSGVVSSGVAGRLSLYPATGNTVDDVFVQNSQDIDINVVAQPARSAAIEYTIPNPGNAVTAADFVLTEGAQTINGNKTFGNNVIVSGDLTVNGALTSLNTTNTTITDKLLTLNKGGTATSAGGSGIEFEENALITASLTVNAAETGFSFLSPVNAFSVDLLTSSLSANRALTAPNVTGTIVTRPNATVGVNTQVAFWNGTDSIISDSGLTYVVGSTRLTAANLTVTNAPTISAFSTAGIVHNSAAGLLSSSLISLTADVTGVLPLANGGTNANLTASAGAFVYSDASALALSSVGTSGQAVLSGGTGVPSFFSSSGVVKATSGVLSTSNVSLTSEVTGTLPIANGGTNQTSFQSGGVTFFNGTSLATDTTDFATYDGAGHTGIAGATNASYALQVTGAQNVTGALTALSTTATGSGASIELNDAADMKITTAAVNTTNATVTTAATIAIPTDTTVLLEIRTVGYRTGGSSGSTGDSAAYIRTARAKNIAGTVTINPNPPQSDFTNEDQSSWNSTITASGANALVSVTGAANNNISWKVVITTTK